MYHIVAVICGLLPVLFAVVRYWKRSHIKVNCWFCGVNNFIPIKCKDGWICKQCEQYNGFKPDGDYNRDIPAQWEESINPTRQYCTPSQTAYKTSSNGLCQDCNYNQQMKVSQLASFEPINPENFDQEIENFSYHLERAYRLCRNCELVVEDKLSETKARVLDINLLMSGKKHINKGQFLTQGVFARKWLGTLLCLTGVIAVALTLCMMCSLRSDHFIFHLFSTQNNSAQVQWRTSSNSVTSISNILLRRTVCPKLDSIPDEQRGKPLSKLLNGSFETYIEWVDSHSVALCAGGLAMQVVSSWHLGQSFGIFLWLAFSATVLCRQMQDQPASYIQAAQSLQGMFAVIFMLFLGTASTARKLKAPKRKPSFRSSSKLNKCDSRRSLSDPSAASKASVETIQSAVPAALGNNQCPDQVAQSKCNLTFANCLALPAKPSNSSVLATGNASFSSTLDLQSLGSQEDTRSDASVDSAFSNPDSITLEAADSLNSSYQFSGDKKGTSRDDDVHSLIETLSIGSRQRSRKPLELKSNLHGTARKRTSLLSPPKLTNIMNESMRSGLWRNTRNTFQENPLPEPADFTIQSLSRPVSPCGSVRSQSTSQSQGSVRSFCTPSTFQPAPSPSLPGAVSWNAPPVPQNMLPVSLPPNPLAGSSSFGGNFCSTTQSSPMPQVVYTPYGFFHQVAGPFGNSAMYMIPPHSLAYSMRSPSSSYGSQYSPQSFSMSPKSSIFERDSDEDANFSPKSSKIRSNIKSSSFLESVWHSRLPILYTTICYLLLSSLVYAFSFTGTFSHIVSKVIDWY